MQSVLRLSEEEICRLPWRGVSLWGEGKAEPLCTSFPKKNPLRPYLCAVPGDLLEEWAYLRHQVFPYLTQLCQARGTRFHPMSVRWLNAKHEHVYQNQNTRSTNPAPPPTDQQLKTRLDIIHQSDFFLCVLGQRYGPSLSEEFTHVSSAVLPEEQEQVKTKVLERNLYMAGQRGGYPWLLERCRTTSSLAELEITQACQSPHTRCLFYFRDYSFQERPSVDKGGPKDTEENCRCRRDVFQGILSSIPTQEREKVRLLKMGIAEACWPVRFFRSVEELGELVKKDWEAIIEELYPACPGDACYDHETRHEYWLHECHAKSLPKHYVPSQEAVTVLKTLNKFVSDVICQDKMEKPLLSKSVKVSCNEEGSLFDHGQSEKSILVLAGERGCGKSTLVSHWLQGFQIRHPEVLVVTHICGLTVSSKDITSLLRRCVRLMEIAHGNQEPLPEWAECWDDWQEPWPLPQLTQALASAAGLRPTLLLLDSLDLLTASHTLSTQAVKQLHWLPVSLPSQCKLIVTTTFTDLTYKSLIGRPDVHVIMWAGLTSDPTLRRDVLLRHLSLPAREPAADPLQSIMGRSPLNHLPLFWAVIGNELRTTGVRREEQEEEELLEEYAKAETLMQLWVRVIQRWISDYGPPEGGSNVNPAPTSPASYPQVCKTSLRGWVWDCLCLLHLSRGGLTEPDLMALLEVLDPSEDPCGSLRVLPLEWAQFRSATNYWIQENLSGQLTFTHQSLGQAIDLLLGLRADLGPDGCRRTKRGFHKTLATFFLRPREGFFGWQRVLEERPWHLEQIEAWGDLHAYLTEPRVVEYLSQSATQTSLSVPSYQLKLDVRRYWIGLKLRGYDLTTSYFSLLPQIDQSEARHGKMLKMKRRTKASVGEDCYFNKSQPLEAS